MSGNTTGSPPPSITSSGPKKRARPGSVKRSDAVTITLNPAQVGRRYGWAEIISPERLYLRPKWVACYVLCRCTGCGEEKYIYLGSLQQGKSKGCQHCTQPRQIPRWLDRRLTAAKSRCTNPKDPAWKWYGARGVEFRFSSVLEAGLWVQKNLGLREDLEIDRIDNLNGHYEAWNLRWATEHQQQSNKRDSKLAENWVFIQSEWPYAKHTTHHKLLKGFTREEIIQQAHDAVSEQRKAWPTIAARLQSMTSPTLDPFTGLPYPTASSTIA